MGDNLSDMHKTFIVKIKDQRRLKAHEGLN